MTREIVTFNGIDFDRYPESKYLNMRNYFYPRYKRDVKRGVEALHREVWKYHKGPIPSKHHIHHIDNDHANNSIENLECLPPGFHVALHAHTHPSSYIHMVEMSHKSKSWHSSIEGKEWHSQQAKATMQKMKISKSLSFLCAQCGIQFESHSVKGAKFCSGKCGRRYRAARIFMRTTMRTVL